MVRAVAAPVSMVAMEVLRPSVDLLRVAEKEIPTTLEKIFYSVPVAQQAAVTAAAVAADMQTAAGVENVEPAAASVV